MSQNHGFKFLLQITDMRLHKGSFKFRGSVNAPCASFAL